MECFFRILTALIVFLSFMSLGWAFIYANGIVLYANPTHKKETKFGYFRDVFFYVLFFIVLFGIFSTGLGMSIDIIDPCV